VRVRGEEDAQGECVRARATGRDRAGVATACFGETREMACVSTSTLALCRLGVGCESRWGVGVRKGSVCGPGGSGAAAGWKVRPSMASSSSSSGAAAQDALSSRLVRPHIRTLKPYTPILPFEVLSDTLGRRPEDIVKLDANENPYGTPPSVQAALASMPFAHIYPDPETRKLRAALERDTGCPAANLLVGCGADELIDLLMRCVLEPGDCVVDTPPTFTMYAFDCDVNGGRTVEVPRDADFRVDVDGVIRAARDNAAKIVFLTSPNNPDGSVMPRGDVDRVLEALPDTLVVLDEAYVEFCEDYHGVSRVTDVPGRDNLIVLRTFSKRAALAGLRVGYGAFPTWLMSYMWAMKQPYNVSVAAETAACAALEDAAYLAQVRDALVSERERMMEGLRGDDIPFLEPYPSQANFILCNVVGGKDAAGVKDALARDEGIMIRHYAKPAMKNFVRISVGTPEHTDRILAALRRMA